MLNELFYSLVGANRRRFDKKCALKSAITYEDNQ